MKELRVPIPNKDIIEIAEIVEDYPGIIIGYLNGKAQGMITKHYDEYKYHLHIDVEDSYIEKDTLYDLLTYLIEKNICDSFKVLEFRRYENK